MIRRSLRSRRLSLLLLASFAALAVSTPASAVAPGKSEAGTTLVRIAPPEHGEINALKPRVTIVSDLCFLYRPDARGD